MQVRDGSIWTQGGHVGVERGGESYMWALSGQREDTWVGCEVQGGFSRLESEFG